MTEIWHDAIIGKDVVIEGDVKIMHGAIIRDGVKIKGSFTIPDGAIIEDDMIEEDQEIPMMEGTHKELDDALYFGTDE